MVSREASLTLYRQLLRAANGFTNYNFRNYFVRVVREDFRRDSALQGSEEVDAAYRRGRAQLEMLRRQSAISGLFPQDKHAME